MKPEPILIIGAGIAGLSAAIRLAATGKRVIVIEQNPAVGGKMSQIEQAGFRWDTGPSVITMRPVLEDLFAAANRRLDDYLTLQPIEPLTRYGYPDGTRLDLSRDWPRTAEQISAIEPRDVAGYLEFLAYAARLHRITAPVFTYGPPPGLASFANVALSDALQVDAWNTLDAAIRRRVRSPQLRQLLGRFATYVGSSPYQSPATLAVIAHVELTEGVWYPRGGVYALAQALQKLALELGVELRLKCRVAGIEVSNGKATGLRLEDGSHIHGAAIIANVDVASVQRHLLAPRHAQPHLIPGPARLSCSGFVMLLGVRGNFPQLAHHNIFFSRNYPREFEQIFHHGTPPTTPPSTWLSPAKPTPPTHRLAAKTGLSWSMPLHSAAHTTGKPRQRPTANTC
jgi:phytoene desaturase